MYVTGIQGYVDPGSILSALEKRQPANFTLSVHNLFFYCRLKDKNIV